MFKIDWTKLITNLLPIRLRTVFNVDWFLLLMFKIRETWDSFLLIRKDNLVKSALTGQLMTLQEHLNDQFDSTNRDIYIDDPVWIPYTNLFNKAELLTTVFIYNNAENETETYLYQDSEEDVVQFVVWVPPGYSQAILEEMKTVIDCFKLAGKQYSIQDIP